MKTNRLIPALLALMALLPLGMSAEGTNTISPYSRFGYGLLSDKSNTMQKAMGGTGYAMRSGREINFMNPASYAAMDSLTFLFDMGMDVKSLNTSQTVDGTKTSGNNFTGGLDYISMQFPLAKWIAASVGIMPLSEVGYNFGDKITDGSSTFNGHGDLNELYGGIGVKPFKGLTLGANVSYLFGTLVNSTYIYNTPGASTSLFERQTEVRDYNLRLGLQYGFNIGEDHSVTLGAVYEPAKQLRGTALGVKYDVTSDSKPDTIATINLKGNASMPALYGGGIAYSWANRLLVEADFTYQPWKDVKFANIDQFGDATSAFSNRWRAALGVQWCNRPRGSWVQRINYRAGLYLCNDYITVAGNNVRERGATLGVGLPVNGLKTVVNLSFEYRNRQANPTPLVKENYMVVTLGVNFNELWFYRNKLR